MKTEKKYQLSQDDYDIVMRAVRFCPDACRALKRATVLSEKSQKKSATAEDKERLSDVKMQELFGANYKHVLYYDFDAKRWNTERYFFGLAGISNCTKLTKQVKPVFERLKSFRGMELVAVVVMGIDARAFPGWGQVIKNPKPIVKKMGASVGTIICRDKASGKIVCEPSPWLGIRCWGDDANVGTDNIMAQSADAMAVFCAKNTDFRKKLMNINANQK